MPPTQIALLGAIAGFTIYLGLPLGRLRAPAVRWKALLNAIAIGILVFLLFDVLHSAWEPIDTALSNDDITGAAGNGGVLAACVAVGLLGLVYFDRFAARRAARHTGTAAAAETVAEPAASDRRSRSGQLSLMIAIGIGLHNFAEGLAIGNSAATGRLALAVLLIIGFGLHNATEGFGIVAPLTETRPSWGYLAVLGLIGGGPTLVGTLVGESLVNDTLSIVFLGLAAGSILYVVIELLAVARKLAVKVLTTWGLLIGLVAGFATDGLVTVAGAAPSTESQEKGMITGQPLYDPVDADTTTSPDLTITLDATTARFAVGGRPVWGQSYNGSFVAPTLHATPGQNLTIRLVNHLPVATNLHFHGLHVSPSGDADDPAVCVAPGQTFSYHLAIPANHPIGTFWYHSHSMGTTCPDAGMSNMPGMSQDSRFSPGEVENQIFAGLSGALVVGDDRTLLPPADQQITQHTLVLKDAQIDSSGHILQNGGSSPIDANNPTVRLVNGQLRPVLTMRPGETQLWRLVNAGADIFYQLQLDGYHFTVISEDGRPVAQTSTPDNLLLPPGKRYDVLVTAGQAPGQTWLRTTAYNNGPNGDSYPDTPLVNVNVTGTPAIALAPVTGAMPTAPANLDDTPIARRRTIALSEDDESKNFFINGQQFSMSHMGQSVFDAPAKLGTVEEWTILNRSGEDHPFHLHTNAFQVMSSNGVVQPYTHQQDTVVVPHQVGGTPGRVVIRIPFTDYPGAWMFHCHIAAHEDNGMMSVVNVEP